MRSRVLATALSVLVLSACSGGGDDPDAAPGESADASPSEAEYAEAHEMYHDLADVLDAASKAAATYQAAVKKAHDADPGGFRDSPAVAAAVEEQQAAVDTREAAVAELADHPAMADEELVAAYEEFETRYEKAMAYQDGYNESYPAFLASGDLCAKVFESGPENASSFTAYAKQWLRMQERAARPCLEVNEELADSANEDVAAVADRWAQLVDERTTAIRRMAQGKAGSDPTLAAVKRANESFIDDYDHLTDFSKRLGKLYPIDAYDAIDQIFEDRIGETAEPSDQPSDQPSDESSDRDSGDTSRVDPWDRIAAERRSLADLLDTLTPEQWATASLCGAWTVKDVAVHLSAGPVVPTRTFLKALVVGRGSFDRANELVVRWRSDVGPEQVTGWLREYADDRFTPPTMDWHAPLSDLRIHTQDMVVPLGLDAGVPREPWRDVLDFLVSRAARRGFVPKGRPDLTLTATDLGWTHGSGPAVAGPAVALALALCGRGALLDQLEGNGAPALRAWCGNP